MVDDDVLVLGPSGTAVKLATAVNGFICLLLLAGVVAGAVPNNGQRDLGLSIGLAIPLLFLLFIMVFATGGSCRVARESVTLKNARWSHPRRIPLTDIAAVGMVYTMQERLSGWRSYLWTSDGLATALPLGLRLGAEPGRATVTDLSASRQGQLCQKLFERVVAAQGQFGLASADRQLDRRGGRKRETAYWSATPAISGVHPFSG